jgi:quercetin dioxygenase-like cupin family protein
MHVMRRVSAILLLLCAACFAQERAPIRFNEVPQRKEILANHRVSASLLELAPHQATPMHQHDRDLLAIFINGGHASNTVFGHKPALENVAAGEVRFINAGYSHATENEDSSPFRMVTIEFAEPQGKLEQMGTTSHYCNPGSTTACVDEKNLFCTAKVCVEDVTIAAGAVTTKHSHTTDHMLVAISDYQLADSIEGKGRTLRARRSGEVEYIPAGITHQMTNTAPTAGRFIVILWR